MSVVNTWCKPSRSLQIYRWGDSPNYRTVRNALAISHGRLRSRLALTRKQEIVTATAAPALPGVSGAPGTYMSVDSLRSERLCEWRSEQLPAMAP